MENNSETNKCNTTLLANMSIDPKFVELTADVLRINIKKCNTYDIHVYTIYPSSCRMISRTTRAYRERINTRDAKYEWAVGRLTNIFFVYHADGTKIPKVAK